jgi:hypothetical protein
MSDKHLKIPGADNRIANARSVNHIEAFAGNLPTMKCQPNARSDLPPLAFERGTDCASLADYRFPTYLWRNRVPGASGAGSLKLKR